MDWKLVADIHKIVAYMTEYIFKLEQYINAGIVCIVANMLSKAINCDHNVKYVPNLAKLLELCTISKNECSYLTLGTPMVAYSHNFIFL